MRNFYTVIVSIMILLTAPKASSLEMDHWMEQLSLAIQDLPISQLFLPSSHDSATYKLEHKFGKGQDITHKLNTLRYIGVGFAVTKIAYKWSQTQDCSISEQLKDGIRYLDLRIIYRDSKKDFYTVHGLYGPSVDDILSQIVNFLKTRPREIIIIQVGGVEYMPQGEENHNALVKKFRDTFGEAIVSPSLGLKTPLKDLWKQGKQVILIYKNHAAVQQNNDILFSTASISDYWANKQTLRDLKEALDAHLRSQQRWFSPSKLFVIQSQMTATTDTIKTALNPLSKGYKSLKEMANDVHQQLPRWLEEWAPFKRGIVLLDFINKESSKKIVLLNLLDVVPDTLEK